MSDAIALFRPRDAAKLRPFLDLDDESDESDGLYAEMLDDGAVLVHTFQPFDVFEQNPAEAREWLTQFGDALPEVHDDPRGLLFFPDGCEPQGSSYDAVVEEVGDDGVWIAPTLADDANALLVGGLPPLDMQSLQSFAGQLLGGDGPVTSFQVAKLFEGVQHELMEALGLPQAFASATPPSAETNVEDAGAPTDAPEEEDDEPSGSGEPR